MNNQEQLSQEKFKKIAEEVILTEDISRARNLIVKLENLLKERPDLSVSQPQLYQYLQDILIKLKFVALPTLSDQKVFELIREHLLEALIAEINIERILEINLRSIPITFRGEFKREVRQSLKENQQKLGSQSLIIEGKPTPQPPTLKNWLLDYDRQMDIRKHSELEREQYLAQNSNAQKLSPTEKDLLRKVLKLYDNLKPTPVSQVEKWLKSARDKGMIPPLEELELEVVLPPLPPMEPTPFPLARPKPLPPLTPRPIPSRPSPPLPTQPPVPEPIRPTPPRRDIYQEPIEEPPKPGQVEPRIEGNIVDLKRQS